MKLLIKLFFAFFFLLILSYTGNVKKNREPANRIPADKTLDTVYTMTSTLLKIVFTAR